MPPQNLNWGLLGRPIKPVAFALMCTMIIICWAALSNVGVLDGSLWADALALGAASVALLLFAAWWMRSQRLAELGLLAAFFVWTTRFLLVLLVADNPISTEGLWLSSCWMLVAGGSYLLEKVDPFDQKAK